LPIFDEKITPMLNFRHAPYDLALAGSFSVL
jgi:hypothetical protein